VTLDEIRACCTAARGADAALHRRPHLRERVELLEDYLNLTAVTRGELEEARLYAQGALRDLACEWDAIVGWEIHLKRRRADVTKHDVTVAKAEIRPDLHAGMTEAKWLVDRLSEQIDRLSAWATTRSPPASTRSSPSRCA
jgi:hypothetical protein